MIRNIMDSMIRKLYSVELEEQDRSSRQDEEMLLKVKDLLKKNKDSICVEAANGRKGEDLAFAPAELGEEIGFEKGFKCAFRLFMECSRRE